MSKRLVKWMAALTAVCMLAVNSPAALMEEEAEIVSELVEAEAAPEASFDLGGEEPQEAPDAEAEAEATPEQTGDTYYAVVIHSQADIYRDPELTDAAWTLSAGDEVLVCGQHNGIAAVGFDDGERAAYGYAPAGTFEAMTAGEASQLQDRLAEMSVQLYNGNVNWPLPRVYMGIVSKASDFTKISNDQQYVVQGVTITARMVGDHDDCWSWARALYNIIWGVKFTSDWEGTEETGMNFIRNLTDEERLLTGENLKKFISQSALGCTLRICSCPRSCSNINKDGCSKHEKHSLIVVDRDADGMVVMDNMTGNGSDRFATRYYTWDKFASHWAKYKMIKYIKWPGAGLYKSASASPTPVVTPEPTPAPVDAKSVSLNHTGTVTLGMGNTLQLTAALSPAGARNSYTFKSSSAKVATVDDSGLVTPVKAGTATVGVQTDNGLTATVKVKVVNVSKVKLNRSGTVTLSAGETLTLQHAVSPAEVCQDVLWASSNESVASVQDGVVTALSAGTATIAVKTVVGGKTAKVKVKVTDPYAVTKVTLSRSGTVSMVAGQSLDVDVKLSPSGGRTTLTWGSSNTAVARVEDGVVTAVGAGTATVGVVTANGKKDSFKVKVTDPRAVTGVKLNKSGTVSMAPGQSLSLTATLSPSGATSQLTWGSSNEKVARCEDGVVTAVAAGTATVGVVTANGKKATFKVKVTDPTAVTSVKLNKSGTVKLKKGATLQLSCTLKPSGTTADYEWKSTDESVARISQSGLVTAVGKGTATVGVLCENGKYATVKIKVS